MEEVAFMKVLLKNIVLQRKRKKFKRKKKRVIKMNKNHLKKNKIKMIMIKKNE